MAANTLMFTFKVNASDLKQKATVELLNGIGKVVFGESKEEAVLVDLGGSRDFLLIFPGQRGSHASLRVYSHGLVTLDIQHYLEDLDRDKTRYPYNMTKVVGSRTFYACSDKKLQISEEYIRSLENKLKNYLGDSAVELNALYSPVRRGQKIWPYTVTADERLVELDIDRVVYDHHSAYQHITILHSLNLGNLLFLDGDIMLGESDLAYTETIMAVDAVDYRDKEVLILGGGDGAILHELLKRQPRHVLMAEIDVAVIEACRTHMRSVCGASLDVLQGHNYKIVIEDCVKVLCDTIAAGRMFDYVINDLTEYPVEKVQNNFFTYDFETSSRINELSLKVLADGGKLFARGNCSSAFDYKVKFEEDIKKLGCKFCCKTVFVPSFLENYDLYEIWREPNNSSSSECREPDVISSECREPENSCDKNSLKNIA